jgi:hypothetical protein
MIRLLAVALAVCASVAAHAQLRTIPPDAKRGTPARQPKPTPAKPAAGAAK